MITEIVILALIAAFLGLRLYSVLGKRSEHDDEILPRGYEPREPVLRGQYDQAPAPVRAPVALRPSDDHTPATEAGIRAIAAADPRFDLLAFLGGAKGAYKMVLEAFWEGDRETLREMCDDDVYEGFDAAIAAREAAGETLDNRLIRIEDATIASASLDGPTARIAVRFLADIAAVTRDSEGTMVAGSLDDAIESRDVWTFTRNVGASSPDWIIDETDDG